MKKVLFVFLILFFVACSESSENSSKNNKQDEKKIEGIPVRNDLCIRNIYVGNEKICIPVFKNKQECLSDSIVKNYFKNFENNLYPDIALYLNAETYNKKDSLGAFQFDDFLKLTTSFRDEFKRINLEKLHRLEKLVREGFIEKNWEEIKSKSNTFELSMGIPTKIDVYNPTENSCSVISLIKEEIDDTERITVNIMTMMIIRNKLFCSYYFKNYSDLQSVFLAKEKNDGFVKLFTKVNSGSITD